MGTKRLPLTSDRPRIVEYDVQVHGHCLHRDHLLVCVMLGLLAQLVRLPNGKATIKSTDLGHFGLCLNGGCVRNAFWHAPDGFRISNPETRNPEFVFSVYMNHRPLSAFQSPKMSLGGDDDRKRRYAGDDYTLPKRTKAVPSAAEIYGLMTQSRWDEVVEALEMGAEPDKPGGSGLLSALRRGAPVYVIKAMVKAGARLTYPRDVTPSFANNQYSTRYIEGFPVFGQRMIEGITPLRGYTLHDKLEIIEVLLRGGAPVSWERGGVQRELLHTILFQDHDQWERNPAKIAALVSLLNRYGAGVDDDHVHRVLSDKSLYDEYIRAKEPGYLPLLVGVRNGGAPDSALGNFTRHPLYTRDVLRALMRLSV